MADLKFSNVDLLNDQFEIKVGEENFLARREGPEIYFMVRGRSEPLGHIYVGNARGGAIYLGQECIGEFQRTDDQYFVRPVNGGRLDPHEKLEADPVEYFFDRLRS